MLVSHGNGPQVGLLALQAEAYTPVAPYPLDVLDAQSEGMVGYLIERGLASRLPGRSLATLLTMVEVDAGDPGVRSSQQADRSRLRRDPRRHVSGPSGGGRSPATVDTGAVSSRRRFPDVWSSSRPSGLCWISGTVVICAGGGGIPVIRRDDGRLDGAEAVIDKDRVSALLAAEIEAELLILATDVDAVYAGWGHPDRHPLGRVTPSELAGLDVRRRLHGTEGECRV